MGQGSTARRPTGRQIAFLEPKTVLFSTAGGPNFSMGKIPRGSRIFSAIHQNTGFNAAGTRVITVGTNGTAYNNIISTVTEETASQVQHLIGTPLTFTQDTEVFLRLVSTGTAATTGRVTVMLAFIPPNALE